MHVVTDNNVANKDKALTDSDQVLIPANEVRSLNKILSSEPDDHPHQFFLFLLKTNGKACGIRAEKIFDTKSMFASFI